jgi:hypothetical protein
MGGILALLLSFLIFLNLSFKYFLLVLISLLPHPIYPASGT